MPYADSRRDESSSDILLIADVSANDFRDFLAWLYGNYNVVNGETTLYQERFLFPKLRGRLFCFFLDDNFMVLLRLSDQYLVEHLKQRCLAYVRYCEKVSLADKFVIAERYNAEALQVSVRTKDWRSNDKAKKKIFSKSSPIS